MFLESRPERRYAPRHLSCVGERTPIFLRRGPGADDGSPLEAVPRATLSPSLLRRSSQDDDLDTCQFVTMGREQRRTKDALMRCPRRLVSGCLVAREPRGPAFASAGARGRLETPITATAPAQSDALRRGGGGDRVAVVKHKRLVRGLPAWIGKVAPDQLALHKSQCGSSPALPQESATRLRSTGRRLAAAIRRGRCRNSE